MWSSCCHSDCASHIGTQNWLKSSLNYNIMIGKDLKSWMENKLTLFYKVNPKPSLHLWAMICGFCYKSMSRFSKWEIIVISLLSWQILDKRSQWNRAFISPDIWCTRLCWILLGWVAASQVYHSETNVIVSQSVIGAPTHIVRKSICFGPIQVQSDHIVTVTWLSQYSKHVSADSIVAAINFQRCRILLKNGLEMSVPV